MKIKFIGEFNAMPLEGAAVKRAPPAVYRGTAASVKGAACITIARFGSELILAIPIQETLTWRYFILIIISNEFF